MLKRFSVINSELTLEKEADDTSFPSCILFFLSAVLVWAEFEDLELLLMVAKCYGVSFGDVTGHVFYVYIYFNLRNHRQSGNPNVNGFIIKCPQIIH